MSLKIKNRLVGWDGSTHFCLVYSGGAATTVNEGIRALDRKSAFAVGQRDARFDLNLSGSVMVWVVVMVNACMVAC